MSTQLCIQIGSPVRDQKFHLDFLYNEEWSPASEKLLLQRTAEILSRLRACARSFRLQIEVKADDPDEVLFLLKKSLPHQAETPDETQKLSMREIEILGLIMLGYTNQQIASKLFISFETVRSHRKNILLKTGTHNTAELVNYYHQTFFEK